MIRFFFRSLYFISFIGLIFILIIYFYNHNKITKLTSNATATIVLKDEKNLDFNNSQKNSKVTQQELEVKNTQSHESYDQNDKKNNTKESDNQNLNNENQYINSPKTTENEILNKNEMMIKSRDLKSSDNSEQLNAKLNDIKATDTSEKKEININISEEKSNNSILKTSPTDNQVTENNFEETKSISTFKIQNFTLINQDNELFNLYDEVDSYKLVYFGFTHCPKICPEALEILTKVSSLASSYKINLKVLFISIDYERDTPSTLKQFLKYFDDKIIGLTGSSEAIASIVKNFGAVYFKTTQEDTGGFNHTSFIYLISKNNEFSAIFHRNDTPENIIKVILNKR